MRDERGEFERIHAYLFVGTPEQFPTLKFLASILHDAFLIRPKFLCHPGCKYLCLAFSLFYLFVRESFSTPPLLHMHLLCAGTEGLFRANVTKGSLRMGPCLGVQVICPTFIAGKLHEVVTSRSWHGALSVRRFCISPPK